MTKQITAASASTGIEWEDHIGNLVVVEPLGQEFDIKTAFGSADAVRANVWVLKGPGKVESYEDILIFQRVMQGQLKRKVGQIVVGRVLQDEARKKPNQSAPWVLADPKDGDLDKASKFWAARSLSAPEPTREEKPAARTRQAAPQAEPEDAPWDDSSEDESY